MLASSINYLIYNLVYFFSENLFLASLGGYSMGILVSFIFAKFWVFRSKSERSIVKSFYYFCLIYFLGGIEMTFIIVFLNQLINNHRISWLFGALIGSLNNYLGSKYFLFKK